MTTKTLTDMTPEEVDEILFPLWAARWQNARYLYNYRELIVETVFPGSRLGSHSRPYHSSEYDVRQYGTKIQELEDTDARLRAEIKVYDDEFSRRGGWTRYVLCGTRNGHLHYRGCSSLRWNTELLLIPQASGLDQSEVVGKFGETACTKCFPDAPVAPKTKTLPEGVCEGSGTYEVDDVNGSLRLYRPYGRCRTCGSTASVTSTGKLRQHKTPKEA